MLTGLPVVASTSNSAKPLCHGISFQAYRKTVHGIMHEFIAIESRKTVSGSKPHKSALVLINIVNKIVHQPVIHHDIIDEVVIGCKALGQTHKRGQPKHENPDKEGSHFQHMKSMNFQVNGFYSSNSTNSIVIINFVQPKEKLYKHSCLSRYRKKVTEHALWREPIFHRHINRIPIFLYCSVIPSPII